MKTPWLVAIVGPPAVGKMTVGQALRDQTGFRLYHNHMVIDLLTPFFEFGSPRFERLATDYRRRFFEEAAREPLGIIATWGWRFDQLEDQQAVEHLIEPFLEVGGRVSFVELAAPLSVRLERNVTENRRAHKHTDWATESVLRGSDDAWQNNTSAEYPFPWPDRHLRIDNAEILPGQAAARIREHFGLPST